MILWVYFPFYTEIRIIFLEPYEDKISYTFLGGAFFFFFIYIYPNEPPIKSLQLMFGPEEKEELLEK